MPHSEPSEKKDNTAMTETEHGMDVVNAGLASESPGHRFEIVTEQEIDATPEQVFAAATEGTAGWLWPAKIEPRLGGTGPFGSTVVAWDPPHHYRNHLEGENGFFNTLDFRIEEREGGRAWLRYVHSGILIGDWDGQYDGARQHTDFYQHTLAQYVTHFPGEKATFAEVSGPASSLTPGGFTLVRAALGIGPEAEEGHRIDLPDTSPLTEAVVDYNRPHFIGLRTDDALYRFFGRDAFGEVVALTIHSFGGRDSAERSTAWQAWFDSVYR